MTMPTLLELAKAGAHFGHHRQILTPKAKKFVYEIRHNIALINLDETLAHLKIAKQFIAGARAKNKSILVVGTKGSLRHITKNFAEKIGAFYVNERWFGGTLTNFSTILLTLAKMRELEEFLSTDKAKKLEKLELKRLRDKYSRYHRFLSGLNNLSKLPDLLILLSPSNDRVALEEANRVGLTTIAITDTNINPELVTYPIPANDDAPKAVQLILTALIDESSDLSVEIDEKTSDQTAKAKVTKSSTSSKTAKLKQSLTKKTKAKPTPKSASAAQTAKPSIKTKTKTKSSITKAKAAKKADD